MLREYYAGDTINFHYEGVFVRGRIERISLEDDDETPTKIVKVNGLSYPIKHFSGQNAEITHSKKMNDLCLRLKP